MSEQRNETTGNLDKIIIVAEVGNVHDGSLGNCHAFIDAVADAGADAVKFQVCQGRFCGPWPERFSFHPQDKSRSDYWERMSFTRDQWEGLHMHAKNRGLLFIASPFSLHALVLVKDLCDYVKVASGETKNADLALVIRRTGKPIVISNGMDNGPWCTDDIISNGMDNGPWCTDDIISNGMDNGPWCTDDIILQCVSMYPTPANCQPRLDIAEYDGISDHSGTIWPSIDAARFRSCRMIEVHVCWSKQQFGADVSSSLTIEEFAQMVQGVRHIEAMRTAKRPELGDKGVYRVE